MRAYLTDPLTLLWVVWLLYWWIAALRVKQPVRNESGISRLAHILPMLAAAGLLLIRYPANWLGVQILPWHGWSRYDAGLALVAIGLAFSVWARNVLGRNWSATVTVKDHHELIVVGAYRWVRHPIYTGILLAFLGTAIAQNEWRGALAFVLVWLSLWRKWKLEERYMQETFGDEYGNYRSRVPAVVPWKLPQ